MCKKKRRKSIMVEIVYTLGHKESPEALVEVLNEEETPARLVREHEDGAELVVGWGRNTGPRGARNGAVERDKAWQLQKMHESGVAAVRFTRVAERAMGWLDAGRVVFQRTVMHERGQGIEVFEPGGAVPHSQSGVFWTMYEPSAQEYRFHVWKGKSIIRLTKPPQDRTTVDGQQTMPSCSMDVLRETAKKAVEVVGYHFGAVDVLGTGQVLEVNTAPAIEGRWALEQYVKAIQEELG